MRKTLLLVGIPFGAVGIAAAIAVAAHGKRDKSSDAFSKDLEQA
jgi:hypothetical protein